jgi:hypothetical protein
MRSILLGSRDSNTHVRTSPTYERIHELPGYLLDIAELEYTSEPPVGHEPPAFSRSAVSPCSALSDPIRSYVNPWEIEVSPPCVCIEHLGLKDHSLHEGAEQTAVSCIEPAVSGRYFNSVYFHSDGVWNLDSPHYDSASGIQPVLCPHHDPRHLLRTHPSWYFFTAKDYSKTNCSPCPDFASEFLSRSVPPLVEMDSSNQIHLPHEPLARSRSKCHAKGQEMLSTANSNGVGTLLNGVSIYYASKSLHLAISPNGTNVAHLPRSQALNWESSFDPASSSFDVHGLDQASEKLSVSTSRREAVLNTLPFAELIRSGSLEDAASHRLAILLVNTQESMDNAKQPRYRYRHGRLSDRASGVCSTLPFRQ